MIRNVPGMCIAAAVALQFILPTLLRLTLAPLLILVNMMHIVIGVLWFPQKILNQVTLHGGNVKIHPGLPVGAMFALLPVQFMMVVIPISIIVVIMPLKPVHLLPVVWSVIGSFRDVNIPHSVAVVMWLIVMIKCCGNVTMVVGHIVILQTVRRVMNVTVMMIANVRKIMMRGVIRLVTMRTNVYVLDAGRTLIVVAAHRIVRQRLSLIGIVV